MRKPTSGPADPGAALAALFPAEAAVAFCDGRAPPPLVGAEHDATATMTPRRLDSFRRGRGCARRALAALGLPGRAVGMGVHREPLWPAGVIGSIAHCDDAAVAVVTRSGSIRGLGIDIEPDGPLEPGVVRLVTTPAERDRNGAGHPARATFTAKESVYKCLWPTLRHFIDFQQVEILWARGAPGPFTASSPDGSVDRALLEALEGSVIRAGHWWIAGATLRAAG